MSDGPYYLVRRIEGPWTVWSTTSARVARQAVDEGIAAGAYLNRAAAVRQARALRRRDRLRCPTCLKPLRGILACQCPRGGMAHRR